MVAFEVGKNLCRDSFVSTDYETYYDLVVAAGFVNHLGVVCVVAECDYERGECYCHGVGQNPHVLFASWLSRLLVQR